MAHFLAWVGCIRENNTYCNFDIINFFGCIFFFLLCIANTCTSYTSYSVLLLYITNYGTSNTITFKTWISMYKDKSVLSKPFSKSFSKNVEGIFINK